MQAKGDRLYFDNTVKIKLGTVELLKGMSSTYPRSTSDFGSEFLLHLLKAVFTKNELRLCGKSSSLRKLKNDKRNLVKGSVIISIINTFFTNKFNDVAIYAVRVGAWRR